MTGRAQPKGWFPMHVIPAKAGIQGSGPQEDKGSHEGS
jgi:hypothetical protein